MPNKAPTTSVTRLGLKPRTKHIVWKAGLYLTPFVFAGILILWGHLLAPWMVITGAIVVLILFTWAGYLHVMESGGPGDYIRGHLWGSISLIVLFSCVILGTVVYLAMRPVSSSTKPNNSNQSIAAGQMGQATSATASPNTSAKKSSKKVIPALPKTRSETSVQGSVTQSNSGGCNQQVVGGNNNANYCMPTAREISNPEKFAAPLRGIKGYVTMVVATSTDDADPLATQVCNALKMAGWLCNNRIPYGGITHETDKIYSKGIICYSGDWDREDGIRI